jgi:hypothetical protein
MVRKKKALTLKVGAFCDLTVYEAFFMKTERSLSLVIAIDLVLVQ